MRLMLMCAVMAPLVLAEMSRSQDKPIEIDAKKLIGQWKPSAKNKGKVLLNMVVEFKTGEKMNATFNINGQVTEVAGTYKVDGNKLTMKFKAGDREMDDVSTILKLTDDELATRDKNGKEEYFERMKAKKDDK